AFLRPHKYFSSVYMRIEVYSFFFNLSKLCQRKYLKATRICKYRLIPYHKFMDAAHLFNQFITEPRSEEHTSELQSRENIVCRHQPHRQSFPTRRSSDLCFPPAP